MPQPLRVALIGLGQIAESRHLPILTKHPHFQVTTAAELDAERAARVAHLFAIPAVSADVRSVIASDAVDVVAILTPPSTHAELAHLALNAGKHVLVEKPLTLDVAQGEALAAHAGRAATKFLVGLNQRHHFFIQKARAMLGAGKLGTVREVSSFWGYRHARENTMSWRTAQGEGGDVLFDLGVHHFDTIRFLLDADVNEINVEETQTAKGTRTTAQLRSSKDVAITTILQENVPNENKFEIRGERGTLVLSLYPYYGFQFIPQGAQAGDPLVQMRNLRHRLMGYYRMRRGGEYALSYRAEWDHFYNVIANAVPPLATARDGLEATRIAAAARESLVRHAPVTL